MLKPCMAAVGRAVRGYSWYEDRGLCTRCVFWMCRPSRTFYLSRGRGLCHRSYGRSVIVKGGEGMRWMFAEFGRECVDPRRRDFLVPYVITPVSFHLQSSPRAIKTAITTRMG
jgi:hypothetical protein